MTFPQRTDPDSGPTATELAYMRRAGLIAMAGLGVAGYWPSRERHDPGEEAYWGAIQLVALMLAALAVAGAWSMRAQRRSAPTSRVRNSQGAVVSFAAALVPALGGVLMMHGASPLVWIGGIVLYLAVWRALPGDDVHGQLPAGR